MSVGMIHRHRKQVQSGGAIVYSKHVRVCENFEVMPPATPLKRRVYSALVRGP